MATLTQLQTWVAQGESETQEFKAIVVTANQATRRPYTYKSKGYKGVGNSTLEMSREEYNQMLLEQLHATQRWENEVAEGWTLGLLANKADVPALFAPYSALFILD